MGIDFGTSPSSISPHDILVPLTEIVRETNRVRALRVLLVSRCTVHCVCGLLTTDGAFEPNGAKEDIYYGSLRTSDGRLGLLPYLKAEIYDPTPFHPPTNPPDD